VVHPTNAPGIEGFAVAQILVHGEAISAFFCELLALIYFESITYSENKVFQWCTYDALMTHFVRIFVSQFHLAGKGCAYPPNFIVAEIEKKSANSRAEFSGSVSV
jgi:hypothetical protein